MSFLNVSLPGGFGVPIGAIMIKKIWGRHLYHIFGHLKFLFKKSKNDKKNSNSEIGGHGILFTICLRQSMYHRAENFGPAR